MALFEDPGTLRRAVESSAVPVLEALEANSALLARERGRFDAESPPPYASSTEDDPDLDPGYLPDRDLQKIMDAPLTDEEIETVAEIAIQHYYAGRKIWGEHRGQLKYLENAFEVPGPDPPLTYLLRSHVHEHRLHLLARSAVRKRWQALGVWNDDWGTLKSDDHHIEGIPWHSCTRGDDGKILEWEWAKQDIPHDETHPAWRAVLLRRGLKRGEHLVPPPRRNPSRDSSAGERDSFITSRPWFQFSLCLAEEIQRASRLTARQMSRANLPRPLQRVMRAQWEKQGLWKPQWDLHRPSVRPGWKWPHESPSPEPEEFEEYDADALEEDLSPFERDEYKRLGPKPPEKSALEFFPWWLQDFVQEREEHETLKREGKTTEPPPRYSRAAAKVKTTARRIKSSAEPTRRSSRVLKMQEKQQRELAEKEEKEEQERRAREAAAAAKQTASKGKTTAKGIRPAARGAKTAAKDTTKSMVRGPKAGLKGTAKPLARGVNAAAKGTTRTTVKDTKTSVRGVKAATKSTTKPLAQGAKATAKGTTRTAAKDTKTLAGTSAKTAAKGARTAAKDANTSVRGTRTAAKGATRAAAAKGATTSSEGSKTPARGTKRKRR
ncbi:hypothetical protein ISF_07772 [Cordyceps fumosorosea ARSEF 2679]|uniref:Uncharacterized protein n=1 Tax=Cordyceps fumosorosea (strain ARSEF 2679) TaxID=1081104 RepID=A0A167NKY4_CORFA|nr:hypothetical protein ISF_07772 [Cordyceps fumosorosea ARSEF 2679]OAA55667.1 hypothetical protein ISF_07772 [Cordyceps fumosorosea ARSEF 2679]